MNIVIVGAGAMGSIYAALLADAGHDVTVVDLWQEHLQAIARDGLRVEGASGDRTVRNIAVANDCNATGTADLIVIATKASGVAAAAKSIQPATGPQTLVLTIQNGLGAGERIATHMATENVLLGVAQGFGASMKGPGHAHHNAMSMIRMGSMQNQADPRVETMASVWREAGFKTAAYEDIQQLIWEKFICNVAYSGPCTVFDYTLEQMMNNEYAWKLCTNCATEAWRAAVAKNINLTFDDPVAYVTAFGKQMPDAKPSMLQDHLAGRRSEIDAINGMVPVVCDELGLEAPYNTVVSDIVRARESMF